MRRGGACTPTTRAVALLRIASGRPCHRYRAGMAITLQDTTVAGLLARAGGRCTGTMVECDVAVRHAGVDADTRYALIRAAASARCSQGERENVVSVFTKDGIERALGERCVVDVDDACAQGGSDRRIEAIYGAQRLQLIHWRVSGARMQADIDYYLTNIKTACACVLRQGGAMGGTHAVAACRRTGPDNRRRHLCVEMLVQGEDLLGQLAVAFVCEYELTSALVENAVAVHRTGSGVGAQNVAQPRAVASAHNHEAKGEPAVGARRVADPMTQRAGTDREWATLAQELHGLVAEDASVGVGRPTGMGIARAVRQHESAHDATRFAHGAVGDGEVGVVDGPEIATKNAHHVRG